jgi:hypothetical protein
MVRTKMYASVPRPVSSPSLKFELLCPEGNSDDAVVYSEESGHLRYKGKSYMLDRAPPEDYEITEVFLIGDYRGEETMFMGVETDDNDMQIRCRLTVIPSVEEEKKLTAMVKDFGTEMAKEVEKTQESLARMKALINGFHSGVGSVCPGFNFARDGNIDFPTTNARQIRNMDEGLEYLWKETGKLSAIEPFSKKRKSCD